MKQAGDSLRAIPTNIVTGFLGVGKTSAILNFLKSKPADERWAVLVNEFGEIGVDGSLFQGQHGEEQQVYISEVPGGCMCCAAGLPMQIALNQLLARARPDRLLIEPTGLGHPVEVLEVLSTDYYRELLLLQKTITLVDARQLDDRRYTGHATFNQQIAIADVVVGNKQDLYLPEHRLLLQQYVESTASSNVEIRFTRQGLLPIEVLQGPTTVAVKPHHHRGDDDEVMGSDFEYTPIPECGFVRAINEGSDYQSIGWRFEPTRVFNRRRLFSFFHQLNVERMKAVFITGNGVFGYNLTRDALSEIALDDCLESRIEIIASRITEQWEEQLFACIEQID